MDYNLVRPPRKLCTDNGIMVAWNGVEKWNANLDVIYDYESIETDKAAPFGKCIIDDVTKAEVKCQWVKLRSLAEPVLENKQDL